MKDGQSLIGFNAHLSYIHNWSLFINRMQALNPALMVAFIDNLNDAHLITRLQAIIPDTLIVARLYHSQDGAFHLKRFDGAEWVASPADTFNWLQMLGDGGQVISLLNEPGTTENTVRLVKWITECMAIATNRNKRVGVANFSTGTPELEGDQWVKTFDLLLKALQNSNHYLCLHEYLPGEKYRVGRLLAALKRCEALGYALPKILITEYGVDTDGGATSGYHSRGWTGEAYATLLCDVAQRVYLPLAQEGVLHGAAVFSYGNSGGWEAFDVEGDQGFFDTLTKLTPRYKAVLPTKLPPVNVPTMDVQAVRNLVVNISNQLDELKRMVWV